MKAVVIWLKLGLAALLISAAILSIALDAQQSNSSDKPVACFWSACEKQRIEKLEARVAKLEAALVEMRGNIREYHFETHAGKFVCGRCRIEEDEHK